MANPVGSTARKPPSPQPALHLPCTSRNGLHNAQQSGLVSSATAKPTHHTLNQPADTTARTVPRSQACRAVTYQRSPRVVHRTKQSAQKEQSVLFFPFHFLVRRAIQNNWEPIEQVFCRVPNDGYDSTLLATPTQLPPPSPLFSLCSSTTALACCGSAGTRCAKGSKKPRDALRLRMGPLSGLLSHTTTCHNTHTYMPSTCSHQHGLRHTSKSASRAKL